MGINDLQYLYLEKWDRNRPDEERLRDAKLNLCDSIDRPPHNDRLMDLANIIRCAAILAHEYKLDLETVMKEGVK